MSPYINTIHYIVGFSDDMKLVIFYGEKLEESRQEK